MHNKRPTKVVYLSENQVENDRLVVDSTEESPGF